ncbi:DUF3000 domain-containing protein [Propionibacterium freudenreichii]|uniref:DUF3000 domain-containing protein n=1 Tax=Propionibacterium freudenreichii TaxID=1744 RepID=UPI00254AF1B2|nr:DUF3000 domain-containing protein [Propionibacterium freudenreichii]MDK9658980.1 DUF3000 domain-containing protein [Propionibacterium freudenreichii]
MAPELSGSPAAEFFARIVDDMRAFRWRPDVLIEEIGSPRGLAPFSLAIEADLGSETNQLGAGRLVLLHDPDFNDAWNGFFRLVSYVRADTDLEIVTDPLIGEVGWSWLREALDQHAAAYTAPAGTVTAVSSRSFGNMDNQPDQAEVEIRASWTPLIDNSSDITPHLAAWQQLMCQAAGMPPLPEGVIPLTNQMGRVHSR